MNSEENDSDSAAVATASGKNAALLNVNIVKEKEGGKKNVKLPHLINS